MSSPEAGVVSFCRFGSLLGLCTRAREGCCLQSLVKNYSRYFPNTQARGSFDNWPFRLISLLQGSEYSSCDWIFLAHWNYLGAQLKCFYQNYSSMTKRTKLIKYELKAYPFWAYHIDFTDRSHAAYNVFSARLTMLVFSAVMLLKMSFFVDFAHHLVQMRVVDARLLLSLLRIFCCTKYSKVRRH